MDNKEKTPHYLDKINPFLGKDISYSKNIIPDEYLIVRHLKKAKELGIELDVTDYDYLAYNLRKQLHCAVDSPGFKEAQKAIQSMNRGFRIR